MMQQQAGAAATWPSLPPRGQKQNQLLFRIYLLYRVLLSGVFLLLLSLPPTQHLVAGQSTTLYVATSLFFLLSNLALISRPGRYIQQSTIGLVVMFCVDIACITLVSDASGGMSSGLPLLLTVTIASSAVLLSKSSLATLIAAIAVLATLADTARLISTGTADFDTLFPAGLLGMLFFVVSGIMQILALRLGKAEAIAVERADDLHRLQRLNEQIVQNMQTGILLVDANGRARVLNAAAGRLLDRTPPLALEQGRELCEYSEELAARLEAFLASGEQRGTPFEPRDDGTQLLARFQAIAGEDAEQTLIFLEDYRPVAAYAQSLKLTSLGRLAGSIAHEIRNPLGAISHATQLLDESAQLVDEDRHLVQMVLSNSRRVDEIVESVLQISRREPPKSTTLVMADWLPAYCQRYRRTRNETKQAVIEHVDTQARIVFDPEHLERILDNLIDNALRHSDEAGAGRRAELRVRVDRGYGECVIDVYDEGPGVAEGDLTRLFEPFFTRSSGGSGLGLYLCRELCELNQSRIAYAPTSDGRSRFRISVQQQE